MLEAGALQLFFRVPDYLLVVIRNYLRDYQQSYDKKLKISLMVLPAMSLGGRLLSLTCAMFPYDGLIHRPRHTLGVCLVRYHVAAAISAMTDNLVQLLQKQFMIRVGKSG